MDTENNTTMPEKQALHCAAPLFIVFADYMGYVSPYIDTATAWCTGTVPSQEMQKFLSIEAMCIYRAMITHYTIAEIKEWYQIYYPIFLEEYATQLDTQKSSLPF